MTHDPHRDPPLDLEQSLRVSKLTSQGNLASMGDGEVRLPGNS